jgi:hypothetical protein
VFGWKVDVVKKVDVVVRCLVWRCCCLESRCCWKVFGWEVDAVVGKWVLL